MSSVTVYAVVEGKTEKTFIENILAPRLHDHGVYMHATIVKKPGENGGDIKFSRIKNHVGNFLKQRSDTFVTLLVDFYGIKSPAEWPGLVDAKKAKTPQDKSRIFCEYTSEAINKDFSQCRSQERFIPYAAIHEFEAMLFSVPDILAQKLEVDVSRINDILEECGEPENINDSSQTSPSHRLERLSKRFKKTTDGIAVLRETGIKDIRAHCPVFDKWLEKLEALGMN
jgi:hypothetical protein